jgi:DNA-binding CsgD family transcriptional regulator
MLVERSAEFSLLELSLADCLAGTGGLAVISGPVGVGKTELLHRIAEQAVKKGALYLGADALRTERSVPLGVLGRVFAAADLPPEMAESVSSLLEDKSLGALLLGDREDGETERAVAPFLHKLTSALLGLSESKPLVIGIDDIHFVDVASLRCLLYLMDRIGSARVLVVVNESSTALQSWPLLRAELLSRPHCRHVRLGLLSPQGVARVLAAHPGLPDACEPLICHQVTGGNPLLLKALIEDYRAPPTQALASAVGVGSVFGEGVLTCLLRGAPTLSPLARALAVLDDLATPALLAELLQISEASTVRAIDAATEAGLLKEGRFRHEQARLAVLRAISPQERVQMHKHVAQLLYSSGASSVAIARHELAAHHADAPWSTAVLCEAAEQALDEDDTGLALACLQLAEGNAADEPERGRIRSGIVRVKWRLDPASAERGIAELLHMARAGQLRGHDALALVNRLVWNGRPAEAAEMFSQVKGSVAEDDGEMAATLYSTGMRLAYTYPALCRGAVDEAIAPPRKLSSTVGRQHIRSAEIIATILSEGSTGNALENAQGVLQQSRLSDDTYEPVLAVLETLVLTDCLDRAAFWCDALLRQAEERRAPTWCAHLLAVRAMISFRQGDLAGATRNGHAALSRIPPRGFGVFIGIPLSILLLAAIRRSRYDDALSHLSVPVPDAMFQTPIGLQYLRARGRYSLARGCFQAAVEDFETCGDLMIKWGLDLPGIVPWRTDLAEVNLKIGAPAKNLVLSQLTLLGSGSGRTRGISLRALAAVSQLKQRPAILKEAVRILQSSGDQLELGDALADLSEAQHSLGEYTKARLTGRRAHQVAIQSSWEETRPAVSADLSGQTAPPMYRQEDPEVLKLSDAERRVASLAAQGDTNRQIAGKLYITVSTVEQHLTRVYKKLEVNRRADLPFALSSSPSRPSYV